MGKSCFEMLLVIGKRCEFVFFVRIMFLCFVMILICFECFFFLCLVMFWFGKGNCGNFVGMVVGVVYFVGFVYVVLRRL